MKTISVSLYSIDELTSKQKSQAYDQWLQGFENHYAKEFEDSLDAFCRIFPVSTNDWSYGSYGSDYMRFTFRDQDYPIEDLSGLRLRTYIINNYWHELYQGKFYSTPGKYVDGKYIYKKRHSKVIFENDCVMTGYGSDNYLLEPVYEFLKNPSDNVTFYGLMKKCLNNWVKECAEAVEYASSMESFEEEAKENNYYFDSSGELMESED
jgi:hypothetical protein